ncbi:pectate lyase, PelA/Pel-15E family [Singulisphaera sp. GP187]|uniref:pectate lyase n=1 Tax=Singulisphaera sp. GP187 TaxID=1882752 RepID=UPI00092CAF6C|nr:pectate lyase [Singulisphaera sp. GP187]SIN72161.1 pectate lyase, PelA/Pel-15E family [Singulisphaera sp. GP187]
MTRTGAFTLVLGLGSLLGPLGFLKAAEPPLRARVTEALRRATDGFRTEVAAEGGYLWRYTADLSYREGERPATATMVWVQPPGTPSVGLAYLHAFAATKDPFYRDAAREVARALVKGQLRSGGWDYLIEFDPKLRARYAYRVDPGPGGKQNVSTLDDNTTQEAVRLLMRVDQALEFRDQAIHEAVEYALSRLIEIQYPNGAWPQRFTNPLDPAPFPVKKASYPESWSRTYPGKDYKTFYTLNDNAISDTIDVMLEASKVYANPKYEASAKHGGDFFLLAQMPEPQPAWAQQYDADMHPAWARKFEPPAITGLESQSAIRTLLELYRATGDAKYLEPIPRALAYLRKSRLPDGRMARFYELKTNTPLYFTKDYQLTESDADMPTHYGFKVGDDLDSLGKRYEALRTQGSEKPTPGSAKPRSPSRSSKPASEQVEAIVKALDARGLWSTEGRLKTQPADHPSRRQIDTSLFIKNVKTLCRYLESTRP